MIIAIILIIFLLLQVLPGNPVEVMMKEKVNQDVIDRVSEQMGLNDPLYIRFGRYLWDMLHGDLGQSYKLKRPVTTLIMTAFPNTIRLAVSSALVAWLIGIPAGIVSAIKKDSLLDRLLMGFAFVGISLPVFWLAMLLQWIFGYKLSLLPISGYSTWQHMVLPAIVLGWTSSGSIARLTRSSLLGVMKNDYIRTARAKGLLEGAVIMRHEVILTCLTALHFPFYTHVVLISIRGTTILRPPIWCRVLVCPARIKTGRVIVIAVESNKTVTSVRNRHWVERPRTQFSIKT